MAEVPASSQHRILTRNAHGHRIGATHHRARIAEAVVEHIRELQQLGWGYRRIARHLTMSKWTVKDICDCTIRGQIACEWRPADDAPAPQ